MTADETAALASGDDPAGLLGRSPRELVDGLVTWCGAFWDYMDGAAVPPWFDPAAWETAVAWIEALSPLLDQRGFVGMPSTDHRTDPLGYLQRWDSYLLRVHAHVWDGEPLSVEMAMAAMTVKH